LSWRSREVTGVRLGEDEIVKMLLELDNMIFGMLASEFNVDPEKVSELMAPIRAHIGAIVVALGLEEKFASVFAQDRAQRDQIIMRLYDYFKTYLYYASRPAQPKQ